MPFRIQFDTASNQVKFIKILGDSEELDELLDIAGIGSRVALETVTMPAGKVYLDTRGRYSQVDSAGLRGWFLQPAQNTVVVISTSSHRTGEP